MSIRHSVLLAHRWTGLALGAFLVLAGATGSLLAFHHEIDAWLVPELHRVAPAASRASFDSIAARIEAERPGLVVGYFVLSAAPDAPVRVVLNTRAAAEAGRLDREAAGQAEVYADPHTGRLLGERRWGELGATRAHVVPMVYRLHMSLLLGEAGQWITAAVAAGWIATMLAGSLLGLPRLKRWRSGFAIKWSASRARALFDLHRAAGLWAGWLLAAIAFTGMYMNLPAGVTDPVVTAVSPFTERPKSLRPRGAARDEIWNVGWDEALASARTVEPEHSLAVFGRVESRGYYQARFMPPGDIVDAGTRRVFVSGRDGSVVGRFNDRAGTAADAFRVWQFPLHSGQAFGLPGRALVCAAGLLPALFALTGLWLWWRRSRLRRLRAVAR